LKLSLKQDALNYETGETINIIKELAHIPPDDENTQIFKISNNPSQIEDHKPKETENIISYYTEERMNNILNYSPNFQNELDFILENSDVKTLKYFNVDEFHDINLFRNIGILYYIKNKEVLSCTAFIVNYKGKENPIYIGYLLVTAGHCLYNRGEYIRKNDEMGDRELYTNFYFLKNGKKYHVDFPSVPETYETYAKGNKYIFDIGLAIVYINKEDPQPFPDYKLCFEYESIGKSIVQSGYYREQLIIGKVGEAFPKYEDKHFIISNLGKYILFN